MTSPQIITITRVTLTLLVLSIASLGKSAVAAEIYLDENCRQNQQLPETDKALVFYQSDFTVNSQKYLFSAARYQDGATMFCLSEPNFQQGKLVSNSQAIQNQFIDKIAPVPKSQTEFLITVREGNGSNVPTTTYKLNLNNPNLPVLTKINYIRIPKAGSVIRGSR